MIGRCPYCRAPQPELKGPRVVPCVACGARLAIGSRGRDWTFMMVDDRPRGLLTNLRELTGQVFSVAGVVLVFVVGLVVALVLIVLGLVFGAIGELTS